MKTIAALNGVDFLRRCNDIRHKAAELVDATHLLDIRKNMPEMTGTETPEEIKAKQHAQAKKNIDEMLDMLLDKHPEETYALLKLLCVPDEGEGEPDGFDLLSAAFEILGSQKVLDFLLSMARLGQTNISG